MSLVRQLSSAKGGRSPARRRCGFTLLELMAVVSLLGLMLFIVLPNLDAILPSARVSSAARSIAATIDYARSQAVFTGKAYELHFNLDDMWYELHTPKHLVKNERSWLDAPPEPKRAYMPKNVQLRDILFASGERKEYGLVKIRLSPFGRFEEFAIYLFDPKRDPNGAKPWTVHFNPLTGLADFYDHEVTIEQVSEKDLFRP